MTVPTGPANAAFARSDRPNAAFARSAVPEAIARVLRDGAPAVFLSPHLDDAVLSCAALMRALATRASVTVVTAFSAAASPPHTRAARTFLHQCRASDAADLFTARRREDVEVLDGLGVRHVHLGHPDALFRRRRDPSGLLRRVGRVLPELEHRYPTFRFDIALGRVSRGDRQLLDEVSDQVRALSEDATVFAPLGVGRHVDHLLARAVGERLGAVLYGDFPYTVRDPDAEAVAAGGRRPWAWTDDLDARLPAIAGYRTQVDALFPDGEIPLRPETYYASMPRTTSP
jgi:LmbE family N-acetylglucosaminyl deacetylase